MNPLIKHTSVTMPKKVYEELKEIAKENDLPLNRVLNAIIKDYLRSRKARENDK